jgi:type II secretory pathway pseudopilin PulG
MKTTTKLADIQTALNAAAAAECAAYAQSVLNDRISLMMASPEDLTATMTELRASNVAAAAFAALPKARRAAASAAKEAAENHAYRAAKRQGSEYSGDTTHLVNWGLETAAETVLTQGGRYSRSCKYSKTNARHTITLTAADVIGLTDPVNSDVVEVSTRDGLPLVALYSDGRCSWVVTKRKSIALQQGWVAYDPQFRGVCYHSTSSMAHARAGLVVKLRSRHQYEEALEASRRAYRFSPAGKAARRAALVASRCAGITATIADARALGFCAAGIAAFQSKHGIGDTASLPQLVATGDRDAVRLALTIASKLAR